MTAPTALEVDIRHPNDLTGPDISAWIGLQQANPVFANPLFGPDFARLVGQVRPDARVAVFRPGTGPVAFLAYHARPGGFARPIGAPFSDYQGLVSGPDFALTGPEVLARIGLGALRFGGLIDPAGRFALEPAPGSAFAIELDASPDDYLERVRAASPKKFKNYRRLEHRLAELGEVRFVAQDRSVEAFEQMLAWKSTQFRETGLQDVLRPDWVRAMMHALFDSPQGLMCSLYVGDQLAASHFGIRGETVFHPWIASANPALAAYSPGQAFLNHAIRAMPGLGLTTYDLGPGHDHYKRPYANVERQLGAGLMIAHTAAGRLQGARDGLWRLSGLERVGPVDKIRRRLDQIATVDPSLPGRLDGLAQALTGVGRRGLGNETASSPVQ